MRLETRKSFSILRILFLVIENLRQLDRMLSLPSCNDSRYVKPPAGAVARVECTDSVIWVCRFNGSCHSVWGGREVSPPAATWEGSVVGRPACSAHVESASYQHCICNHLAPVTVTDSFTTASLNYIDDPLSHFIGPAATLTSRYMYVIHCHWL